MAKRKTRWEKAVDVCKAGRAKNATAEQQQASTEVLKGLGPQERRAFLGVCVKELPDIGQQMGKTDAELEALVKRAKAKLTAAGSKGSG